MRDGRRERGGYPFSILLRSPFPPNIEEDVRLALEHRAQFLLCYGAVIEMIPNPLEEGKGGRDGRGQGGGERAGREGQKERECKLNSVWYTTGKIKQTNAM